MDEIGVLRDMHPAQAYDGARARLAAKRRLMAEVAAERDRSGGRWPRSGAPHARLLLVAAAAAVAALALVPIGGASLGTRAYQGITSLWTSPTPANQQLLDSAANDARATAGTYYAGAVVHDDTNTVEVYLTQAPQSIIDQLQALHPGLYVIHNDAQNSLTAVLALEHSIDVSALRSEGIDVVSLVPTNDGYLRVGVSSDVAAAQAALDAKYGPNDIQVFAQQPINQDNQNPPGVRRG